MGEPNTPDITNLEFKNALMTSLDAIKTDTEHTQINTANIETLLDLINKKPLKEINDNIKRILELLKAGNRPPANQPNDKPTIMDKAAAATKSTKGTKGTKSPGDDIAAVAKQSGQEAGQEFGEGVKTGTITSGVFDFFANIGDHFKPLNFLMKSLYDDERKFLYNMREIAFVTQGITGDMQELQNEFAKIDAVVEVTGKSVAEFQEKYVGNLQKGTRTTKKELMEVTKTALYASTMIGDKSNAVNDTFREWHVSMGMTNYQIDDVTRGMEQIGRDTGLVGQALVEVVNRTKTYVEHMRNAGTLTAEATRSVMALTAAAEKFGAKSIDNIIRAGTSNYDLLIGAEKTTQNFMYRMAGTAGKLRELQQGTWLTTKQGMGEMADSMDKTVRKFTGGRGMEDLKKLNPMEVAALDRTLRLQYKMSLGEYKATWQSATEASKTFAKKQAEINEKLKDQATTEAEKLKLIEDQRKLYLTEGMNYMTKLEEAAEGTGKNLEQASEEAFKAMGKDGEQTIRQMAASMDMHVGKTITGMDAMRVSAMASAKALKEAGGQDFSAKIAKASNLKEVKSVLEEMRIEEKKQGVDAMKGKDPIDRIEQTTKKIEEHLKMWLRPILPALAGILGYGGLALGVVGQVASLTRGFSKGMEGAGSLLTKWFTRGQSPVAIQKTAEITTNVAKKAMASQAVKALPLGAEKGLPMGMPLGGAKKGGLGIPEFDWASLRKSGMSLLRGAAAMAVFVVALIAIMGVILFASKAILGVFGLKPEEALKLSLVIAGIIVAAGLIALACIGAAWALLALGNLATMITGWGYAVMLIGAAAMVIMSGVMISLAIAIIGMAKGLMAATGIDMKVAAETAGQIAAILGAAATIALAVLTGMIVLTALGLMAVVAGLLVPVMMYGTTALEILTPVMIDLAVSIIKMGEKLVKKAGGAEIIKKGVETAEMLAKILAAAGAIAAAVLVGSIILTALASMYLIAGIMVPIMAMGTTALLILGPPMVELAIAILQMAQNLVSKAGGADAAKKGAEAADSLSKILSAASDIAWTIIKMSSYMAALGAMALVAFWMAPLILLGAIALSVLAQPTMAMVEVILHMAKVFVGRNDPKKATETAEALASVFKSASTIAEEIDKIKDRLLKFTPGWFSSITSLSDSLWLGIFIFRSILPPIKAYMSELAFFGQEIMSIINPDEAEKIIKSLNSVNEISQSLDKAMEDMQKNFSKKQMSMFGSLMKYGIFGAIVNFFPKSSEMTLALNIMKTTVGVLTEMVKMIDQMQVISEKLKGKKMDSNLGSNMRHMIFEASYVKAALQAAADANVLTESYVRDVRKHSRNINENIYDKGGKNIAKGTAIASKNANEEVNKNVAEAQKSASGGKGGGWINNLFNWITGASNAVASQSADLDKTLQMQFGMNHNDYNAATTAGMAAGDGGSVISGMSKGGSFWVGEQGPELVTVQPANKKGGVNTAPSIPNVERVERDHASISAGTKGNQTANLGKLENLNSNQVALLTSINMNIAALVASLKPSVSHSGDNNMSDYEESIPGLGMSKSSTWAYGMTSHPGIDVPTRNS